MFKKPIFILSALALFANSASALTLQEAFDATLSSNPTFKAKKEEVAQAKEQKSIDFAPFLPTVDGVGNWVVTDRRNFSGGPTVVNKPRAASLRVRQTVFAGGENLATLRRTERLLTAAESSLKESEQQTLLTSAQAYLDVLLAQRILELNNFQVDVLSKQLDATRSRFKLGEITRTDVSQAQARLAAAKATAVAAKGRLIADRAIFEEIIGLEPQKMSWPKIVADIPNDIDELIERVLAAHPLVEQAVAVLAAENHTVSQARSGYFPDVTAEASVSRREKGFSAVGNGDSNELNVTLNAEFPIFRGGATAGGVRQALAKKQQAHENYQEVRRSVRRELVDAFYNYQTVRAELTSRIEATRANKMAYDGVKQETLLGARTTLDLLDAEEELLQAKVDKVTAQYGKVLSTFRLLAAMGDLTSENLVTLWQ